MKLKRSWQLMVTTDKPVYQPGQMIHLRSLALAQPELKPVAGHNVSYAIHDPKGNVIFRKQDVTSRFGIASADCPLADEIIEGPYQIQCQVGDTTSDVTVEVKKYVLPKFKIEISLDQPYYQPGQKAHGTVDARYFFGKPVEDAEVEIAVDVKDVGTERLPLAAPHRCRRFHRLRVHRAGHLAGRRAAFRRRVDLDSRRGRRFGRPKDSGRCRAVVTAQPIHIEVIPESATLVKGVANIVYLFTSYPDGRPAQTRITISNVHARWSATAWE